MAQKKRTGRKAKNSERFSISEIKGKRGSRWLLTGYTKSGERIRQRFKSEASANGEKTALIAQSYGQSQRNVLTNLTEQQFKDAEAAYALLGDKGEILDAVNFYLSEYRHTSGLPMLDALNRYVDTKEAKNRSPRTIYEIRNRVGSFVNFMQNRAIDQVLLADAEDFLKQFGGQTYNNYRSKLLSFFKWAERESLCTGNPFDRIERYELVREPDFFTPKEVQDLLRAARDTERGEMLPYLAIALFAGLRPDSELKKLTWRGINFEDEEIKVPKGKTGVARTVKASKGLMAFLTQCDRRQPIIPKGNFQRKLAKVKRAAGFKGGVRDSKRLRKIEDEPGRKHWIPDGTRHTYITYKVRECGDIYKTATSAGNSPGVIKAHYEGAATSSEAAAFWGITPTNLDRDGELLEFAG